MDERIDEYINHLLGMVDFLRGLKGQCPNINLPSLPPTSHIDRLFRKLLLHDKWPAAISSQCICDPHSDHDKICRAESILDRLMDRSIAGQNILDFGCGEGHVPYVTLKHSPMSVVGYDLKSQGWERFKPHTNLKFTTDVDDMMNRGPYDSIVVHDVIDHVDGDPILILKELKTMLAFGGKICLRFHPYSSRHASHAYHIVNKAYCHLVFSPDELRILGLNHKRSAEVIRPLQTYRSWIEEAGLQVVSERVIESEVEHFFRVIKLAQRLKDRFQQDEFPEEHLKVQFVDYTLQ